MKRKIISKIFAIFLCGCLSFGGVACKDENPTKTETQTVFWTAPTTVKYRLEDTPDLKYGIEPSVEMCKNETESVQMIVTPDKNISSYDVTVGELKCGDSVIPARNVSVFVEWYINISQPTAAFPAGYYPDAMIPLAYTKQAGEDKIKKGQNQVFVLQVTTDENTPAGVYTAPITVRLDGEITKKQLSVTVWDYAISTASHTKTAFAVWDEQLVYGHYDTGEEIVENYYELLNDYRVTPLNVPNIQTLDVTAQAEKIFEYALREDVSGVNLPFRTVTKTVVDGKDEGKTYYTFDYMHMETLLRLLIEKEKASDVHLMNKYYVYMGALDEPTAAKYHMVREANNDFMRLKQSLLADEQLISPVDDEILREELLNVEFVITTPFNDSLTMDRAEENYRGVDTWCPKFDDFYTEETRAESLKRQAAGDHVWWYGCVSPANPYPTYHIDDYLAGARIQNWMMMDYGIEGNLYWSVNIYSFYDTSVRSYVYRDLWNDPLAFPGANGDGYLVYPGHKYGYKGAIPTLRLEAVRDGMEDYESLYLLRELTEGLARRYGVVYDFNESMSELYDLLYKGSIPQTDEQKIAFARRRVAEMIEAARAGILTSFEKNDKTNKISAVQYAPDGVEILSVGGQDVSGISVAGGKKYAAQFVLSAEENLFGVTYSVGGREKTLFRYVGGKVTLVNSFDAEPDLAGIGVTDGDEYDEIEDMKVSLSKNYSVSGSSLRIDLAGVEGNENYRPALTMKDVVFTNDTGGIKFYVYNASASRIVADVRAVSATFAEEAGDIVLEPHAGRTVYLTLDERDDREAFDRIQLVFEHLSAEDSDGGPLRETAEIYIDNLALVKKGFSPKASEWQTVRHGEDDFGNFIGGTEDKSFVRADGVLFDFEELASVFYNIQYRYVNPTIEILHDEKYVTSLNGAMGVTVKGQPEQGPNYCPAITFKFEKENRDMRKVKQIVVDVTVEADRALMFGFNIQSSGGTTENKLREVQPGKQQFVFDLTAEHRFRGDVYRMLTEDEKTIVGVEIWMNNLAVGETPFRLVFDNLRLVY